MIFFSILRNSQTAKRRERISATGCAAHRAVQMEKPVEQQQARDEDDALPAYGEKE